VTALPPVVSLLAAFGPNVPPPLPPGADFLAILTAAEASVPGPAPQTTDAPPSGEQKPAVEKPKKTALATEPPPVAWVSIPMAAPQDAPPVRIAIELPFSESALEGPDHPEAAERATAAPAPGRGRPEAPVPPAVSPEALGVPLTIVPDAPEAPVRAKVEAAKLKVEAPQPIVLAPEPRVAAPERRVAAPEPSIEAPELKIEAPQPKVEAPERIVTEREPKLAVETSPAVGEPVAMPAVKSAPPKAEEMPRRIEARAPRPKQPLEAAPAPDADPPQEQAPAQPGVAPTAGSDVAPPTIEGAPPTIDVAAPPEAKDVDAPAPQQPEVRAKAPLAFSAMLVATKPAHADAKVSATAAGAPAPEPQRRTEPHPQEESKPRAIRAPEETEILGEVPREQPATNTPPPRDLPAQEAPERADAAPKADAPKPAVHTAAAPPDTPKASPIARDIRLEVAGADRKVELRVIERAGEVQVAVRTPDERLAGTLREQLPLLSSRLEQSGFRADQWRTADAGGAERRLDVQSSAESSGRAPEHRGGNEQQRQQQEERRPLPADERRKPQEKGTAFEWLMQSLR
jgi:hypothetical protein